MAERTLKVLRTLLKTGVVIAVLLPVVVYVLLSLGPVQDLIRREAEKVLSEQLGAEVAIADLTVLPFNRVVVDGVTVVCRGDTVGRIANLGAGIDIWQLVTHGKVNINYGSVNGLDLRVSRDSAGSPLNIQPIIDRLTNRDRIKPPKRFNLRVNTVVVRNTSLSYDILSAPRADSARFDPSHIKIEGLRLNASLPKLSNNDFAVALQRMDFREQSGLQLTELKGTFAVNDSALAWTGLQVSLPQSEIDIADGGLRLRSLDKIKQSALEQGLAMSIAPESTLYPPDLAPFVPSLGGFDETVAVDAQLKISKDEIAVKRLNAGGQSFHFAVVDGEIHSPLEPERLTYSFPSMETGIGKKAVAAAGLFPTRLLKRLPSSVRFNGSASGSLLKGGGQFRLATPGGTVEAEADYSRKSLNSPLMLTASAKLRDIDPGAIGNTPGLTNVDADITLDATLRHSMLTQASLDARLRNVEFRRHTYEPIHISASLAADTGRIEIRSFDPMALFDLNGTAVLSKTSPMLELDADIKRLNPFGLNLTQKNRGVEFSTTIAARSNSLRPDRGRASVDIRSLAIKSDNRPDFTVENFSLVSQSDSLPRRITVASPVINGEISGDYDFASLAGQMRSVIALAMPTLFPDKTTDNIKGNSNDFHFDFTIEETEPLREIFHLPVSTVYPMTLSGAFDSQSQRASVDISIPYIRQGNKLIEDTRLTADIDASNQKESIRLLTRYPSADGLTTYVFDTTGDNDVFSTDISWKIDRARRYDGQIRLNTTLSRNTDGLADPLRAEIDVLPSTLAFNDSVWDIHPARILWEGDAIDFRGVNISRDGQFVKINGRGTASDADSIAIDIHDFDLDYVFEAIGIDKFKLGGRATGSLYASAVLSAIPHVETEGIRVKDIAFNHCVLGQGLVKSHFDMERKAIAINGTINQPNGKTSTVDGALMPFTSELDFRIAADETRVGFMEQYMGAFASDITGYGSGDLHIFGNFRDVDLEGDVFARDLRLRLNFTNTYYTATDSLFITPGRILLRDITLRDPAGHTGTLNGTVTHDFFRSPQFNFTVSNVRDMLVYDETSKQNPDWYGHINASGSARVKGNDDLVKIDIDVTTAKNSTFTFVLSDYEEADEFTFLTFRDKNAKYAPVEVEEDIKLSAVNRLRELLAHRADTSSAEYEIELKVDITPEIEIDLVMDPVAGDKIRSNGAGNLRMLYTSKDNDLRMFGTYRLNHGFYNFTLQDIIIKDFVIKEGSTISFTGDPLTARLDIVAYYALNANLTDLDESFRLDKELNRTNVPVHALLKVTGDIQQPEIGFDLEFPTLTSDIYRKVRSIVSTEEMMNRQIIYLLALNRFYTPDYMATTKGNELFSVASSTISSQLSNMLGQLSDRWMISPNFRSDRGDFSDMEVDLALSSRLLNNRLLLNGNFGYRDKSMNNNQFIGDFDIEYLLNKSGSIRLKAYNHFNDQNYYLRTANTTQGVGVQFRHDFDNIFGFLRRHKLLPPKNTSK